MTRESVLSAVRSAMERSELQVDHETAQQHLAQKKVAVRPAVGDQLQPHFCQRLDAVLTSWQVLPALDDVPLAMHRWLSEVAVVERLVVAPALRSLDWTIFDQVDFGAAGEQHLSSVTPSLAGIAETGSLLLEGTAESPATLAFMPENHAVVLQRDQIVRHIEDVWPLVRQRNVPLPRAIHINTGPSRTADIEQTLEIGAHGPRRMQVFIIDSPGS